MSIARLFKAYDVRATYPENLNEDAAWQIGFAAGQYFLAHADREGLLLPNTLLVSRDMRPHSPGLCAALSDGIRAAGMDVIDLGMCDTSFIYFAINHLCAAGGIQTTASHNPIHYNGFKISGPQARPIGEGSGLEKIRELAEQAPSASSVPPKGKREDADLWSHYRDHVLKFLRPSSRPLTVFIDGSNGMAGVMVPKVFGGVPNLRIVDVNFEIGGEFAHEPNPLIAENMEPTQQGVKTHSADLGACFDGDADRCILADDRGRIISCDHLTALLACEYFIPQQRATPVIYDLRSSKVVEETIFAYGGKPVRSRVGHVFMKQALRSQDGIFGGELSGHFYFKGNFYADSGAIALASVLTVLGRTDKKFSDMMDPYINRYSHSGEINFKTPDKAAALAAIREKFKDQKVDELDGVTVDAFDRKGWWFNVRPSNTEPLLRLNAEAKEFDQLYEILEEIKPMLGEEDMGGH